MRWIPCVSAVWQARAADHQGPVAACLNGLQVGAGVDLVGGDIGVLAHTEDVDLMVGVPAPLGGRQLGGANVHAAVELGGVGVKNLGAAAARPAQGVGQVQGQVRLSGGGRADDGDAHPGAHNSGRSGRIWAKAWVAEDRAVSRWRRNWESVAPARRSAR